MSRKSLHIGIATTGLKGILNASIAMALRLKKEGHRITYMCPLDVKSVVESNELEFFKLESINFHFELDKEKPRHFWMGKKQYEKGKRILKIDGFKKSLRQIDADKLLIDVELHELIFGAIELNMSVYPITAWFPNLVRANVPPLVSKIQPGKGFNGSMFGIWFSRLHAEYYILKRIVIEIIKKQDGRRQILKKYANEIGVSSGFKRASYFPPLFEYDDHCVITLNLMALDYQHTGFPKVMYAGAMIDEHRDLKLEIAETKEIDSILDSIEDKKLIYCSVTSMSGANLFFLNKIINAFQEATDWVLFVSLGGKTEPKELGEVPRNVYLFKWLPQLKVLRHADISINHGGIHTINECIHFKVPMLIYSGEQFDQNGCASRVAYHGIGLLGNKESDTTAQIKEKITRLLENENIENAMKKMHDNYSRARKETLTKILALHN